MHVMKGISLLLALLLAGCRLPSLLPQTPGAQGAASPQIQAASHLLQGRLKAVWRTQVELPHIAEAATVSLIDGATGYTAATTVTNPDGTFAMRFQEGFLPVEGRAYYLEALKGIKGRGPTLEPNDLFNQAGADAVRLRTILYYQSASSGWVSPYNAQPGPIYLSRETTTLSVALFLKQHTLALDLADFIGCLDPDTDAYTEVAGLTAQEFADALVITNEAIAQDRDPIQFLAYDSSSQSFMNLYNGHSIDSLSPSSGAIGDEITIIGDGFDQPGELTVRFNGVEATLTAAPTKDRLKVKVPVGARSGPVSVRIGTVTQGGGEFVVNSFDGHRSMVDGILYVANYDRDRLVKVADNGTVEDFVTVPDGPTQVVAYAPASEPSVKLLFVASQNAGKISKIDLTASTPTATDFVTVAGPTGMAFLGNVLYVSRSAGLVSRYNLDGTSAGADIGGLADPTALAFDYAGNLFVALDGSEDRIKRVEFNPDASVKATQDWAYLTDPRGLSVDSAGALYVASYKDDLVYRILPSLATSVFARVPAPAGLMLDDQGYLYVASDSQHQIYRVSPLGDIKPYAFGISHPRGVAVDGNGNLYVSLSQSNAILKVEDRGAAGYRTRPFVTGIANPHAITWRNDRLYIAHREAGVVSSADANGAMRTEVTGLTLPGGADVGSDGKLYSGRYGTNSHAETLPPNIPWHQRGDLGGIEITSPGNVITPRYRILRTGDRGITGLNDGTRFAVNTTNDSLVMYQATNGHNSSYRYRVIKDFGADPLFVERDATGANLFVTVSGRNTVYRFSGADATWTEATLSGFTAPTAMSYDAGNDRLYVQDGSTVLRISDATQPGAALDGGWSATVSGVTDIAYRDNTLFAVRRTAKEIQTLDTTVPSPTPALYVNGFDAEPYNILAHPTNGELYCRTANNQYAYRVTASKVIQLDADYTGWSRLTAYGIAPDGTRMRAESVYPYYQWPGKTVITSLIQSHEVAFHGNQVYVGSFMNGSYTGVYRYNLDDGTEMLIRGVGTSGAGAIAVNSSSGMLYVGGGDGTIYAVDDAGAASTLATTSEFVYGLDITALNDTLWAISSARNLFSVRLSDNQVQSVQAGLSQPRF
jgi:hypothetical protein